MGRPDVLTGRAGDECVAIDDLGHDEVGRFGNLGAAACATRPCASPADGVAPRARARTSSSER